MRKQRTLGIEWLALLTALCWGLGSFFGKRAMKIGQLSPLVGILLRTILSLILFLILLLLFGKKLGANLRKEIARAWVTSKWGLFQILLFEGVLAGGIGMFLYYLAISGGELSLVMPLAFLSPFWGTLLALLFKSEQPTYQRIIGLFLTFIGILIISSRLLSLHEILTWRIEYVALLTGICWGIGSFFGKRGMKKTAITPFVGITLRTATSSVILLIIVFSLGPNLLNSFLILELSWIFANELGQFFLILFFEGILAGFFGMLLYYIAIKKGELSLVMPLAFTSPFWGTFLSIIWGVEQFTIQRLAGMFFILTGIIFITAPSLKQLIKLKNSYDLITPILRKK
ncbi:MAG: DMT family transporter [Candidatus Heimdallarchaeota archaeon]|nr:DMT family transporter [Candidatus Heimdallarchaeota archaeon]